MLKNIMLVISGYIIYITFFILYKKLKCLKMFKN